MIFTFPALIILGAWERFSYVETTIIAGLGLVGQGVAFECRNCLVPGSVND